MQNKIWNAEFKLHLYPVQLDCNSDRYPEKLAPNALKKVLNDLKFIGKVISDQPVTRYEVGDKFLSQLTFMGCSPDIELEPQNDKPYCYIEIERRDELCFIAGKNLKPAKCPHCKSFITQLRIAQPSCANCKKDLVPEKLNWRKTAFYASSWITIGNIYELEAIPNDSLLIALDKETGIKWKVAYIRYEQESS